MAETTQFWTEERAQTAQDFAIGISIFLLVVGAVFAYFPTLFTPYGQAIQGEDTSAQAERVATLIVDGADERNTIGEDEYNEWFEDQDGGDLQQQAGLASTSQVNITITPLDPDWDDDDNDKYDDIDDPPTAGHIYQNQDASSVSRIVRIDNEVIDAYDDEDDTLKNDPAYRLTVRVW